METVNEVLYSGILMLDGKLIRHSILRPSHLCVFDYSSNGLLYSTYIHKLEIFDNITHTQILSSLFSSDECSEIVSKIERLRNIKNDLLAYSIIFKDSNIHISLTKDNEICTMMIDSVSIHFNQSDIDDLLFLFNIVY